MVAGGAGSDDGAIAGSEVSAGITIENDGALAEDGASVDVAGNRVSVADVSMSDGKMAVPLVGGSDETIGNWAPVEVGENVIPDSVGDSVGTIGMVELSTGSGRSVAVVIGSSVAVAVAVGSEVAISVALETGMSAMVVSGSVVCGYGSEVIGSEIDGLVLETSGVLPGGDMVGEASDTELEG